MPSATHAKLEDVRIIYKESFDCRNPLCMASGPRQFLKLGRHCPYCGTEDVALTASLGVRGRFRGEEYGDFVVVNGDLDEADREIIARELRDSIERGLVKGLLAE